MCKSFVVLMLLSIRTVSLPAQDAAQWRDAARRAEAEYRALRDSMVQGDSTVREVARKNDLVLGASENLRAVSRAAFDRLLMIRERWFSNQSPSASGFRIVLRVRPQDPSRLNQTIGLVVVAGLPDNDNAVRIDRIAFRDQIEHTLLDLYGEMMFSSLPPAIQSWLGGTIPLSMSVQERKRLTMYAIATGTGGSQRACRAGSAADCLYVLGLGEAASPDPGAFYAALLRSDLLFSVLDLQSSGWTRLQASTDRGPLEALVSAAGIPSDSLVRYWLGSTLSSRPRVGPLEVKSGIGAIGWIGVLLLAVLLGGRSRWV